MPELGWVPKSKEITAMATGKDGADIRMWQEIGLYWPKVEDDLVILTRSREDDIDDEAVDRQQC